MKIRRIYGRGFYRWTTEDGKLCKVGYTTFNKPVWLVGLVVVACGSKNQNFELMVTGGYKRKFIDVSLPKAQITHGAFENWLRPVYFFSRVDSTKRKIQDVQFVPEGSGFYIPKGQRIYFGMWSPEHGRGGQFILYYLPAEE